MAKSTVIQRRVVFYQLLIGNKPVRSAADFDFTSVFSKIKSMPNKMGGRRVSEFEDSAITCFVDGPKTVQFGRLRFGNLPARVEGEVIDDVPLTPDGGLFEATHIVFFAPNIIGAAFNFYAPRLTNLGYYLSQLRQAKNLEVLPIMKSNALADLKSFDSLHRFDLQLASNAAPTIRKNKFDLLGKIADASQTPTVATIRVSLSAERGRNGRQLDPKIRSEVTRLAELSNLDELVTQFRVEGYYPDATRLDAVDLLNDDLVAKRDFILENRKSKTLNSSAAYDVISKVYKELRPDKHVSN